MNREMSRRGSSPLPIYLRTCLPTYLPTLYRQMDRSVSPMEVEVATGGKEAGAAGELEGGEEEEKAGSAAGAAEAMDVDADKTSPTEKVSQQDYVWPHACMTRLSLVRIERSHLCCIRVCMFV